MVEVMHEAGVVHGDLHRGHVLVLGGWVWVIGFGQAQVKGNTGEQRFEVLRRNDRAGVIISFSSWLTESPGSEMEESRMVDEDGDGSDEWVGGEE